jgi:4a-hydroxytetrahydrobiopterin dehydratase
MKTDLIEKQCAPCHEDAAPLKGARLQELHGKLERDWQLINAHHLEREYSFRNFREALDFTNRVGAIAEKENHHPDIYLTWGKVGLKLWTHNVDGLTENDFILAAKVDAKR